MTAAIEVASKAAVKIVVNAVSGGSGGGVSAHSALTGLTTGDDHTQYQRSESVFTSSATYTVTSETIVLSAGSTVVLPSAQAKAGRSVLIGAGANLSVNTSGSDTFIDGTGSTTYSIQSGNGVGFSAVNVSGNWGWIITTRNGPSYDMPAWYGLALAAGKVLRIDGTGAPAWANIDAADVPSLAASKITSGTFDVARLATGTASSSVFVRGDGTWATPTSTLADGSVTTAKLADTAVTTAKITDANVTTAKLADAAVTTAKITDANVTTAKLADSAVTSAKIADGTIVNADISASAAIATSKISGLATIATSGSASDLSTGTVPSAQLSTKAVGGLGAGSGVSLTASAASILSSTITLPACAAGDVLMVEGSFTINNNSTASRTYTGVLKLGSTSILTFTLGSQAVATRVHAFQAYIRVNTTTSQSASANLVHNTVAGTSGVAVSCSGVATETISSALALDLTLVSSTGTTTQTGTLEHITVTRLAA